MEDYYFSMDSFNRDSIYCCNAVSPQPRHRINM